MCEGRGKSLVGVFEMKWYLSEIKQSDGKWRTGYAVRINADNLWVVKLLLTGNRHRKRAQMNRYLVNFGSKTTPVFIIADMGDVKRKK